MEGFEILAEVVRPEIPVAVAMEEEVEVAMEEEEEDAMVTAVAEMVVGEVEIQMEAVEIENRPEEHRY